MRHCFSITVLCLLLSVPGPASAGGDFQGPVAGGLFLWLGEIVWPDIKCEIVTPEDYGIVLAWPIVHPLVNFGLDGPVAGQIDFALEPQWQLRDTEFRGLATTRLSLQVLRTAGPLLEGGGILGTDGSGGMVGAGLFVGTKMNDSLVWGQLALVYRREWTTGTNRHVVFLDAVVTFPFTKL